MSQPEQQTTTESENKQEEITTQEPITTTEENNIIESKENNTTVVENEEQDIPLQGKGLVEVYLHYCKEYKCRPNSRLVSGVRFHFDSNKSKLSSNPNAFCKQGVINLNGNYVGDRGVRPVLELVKRIQSCTTLLLRQNGIRNPGVKEIVEMAKNHPSLTSIDLSHNAISLGGGNSLLELVRTNKRITSINLDKTRIEVDLKMRIQKFCDKNKESIM